MIYKTAIKKIAVFDRRSLLCSYKLGSVTLTLVLIVFFCLSQHENSEIVKIVSFGSSVGAIIAVFVSHFLTEKVHEFAERLGNLISKKGVEINQTLLTKESLNFPVELAETFRVVFERRVQEHYDQEKQNFEMKMIESRSELASQVAHDIRSPIAALEVIAEHTAQFPEEKRLLIKGAISRIKDIANNLLEKNRALTLDENASLNDADFRLNPNTIQLIPSLIDSLLSEKREQYRTKSGVEIQELFDETSYGLFASVQTGEFKRVLSNLIDNAVESIEDEGKVVIRIFGNENQIRIKIKDTGKGIAKDLLSKLGSKGQTHGKNSGTGLGLYHARLCARKWGGDLLIRSQPGKGTSVYFDLLRASAPDWFMPELKFTAKTQLVILDDDHFIHDLWRSRLKDIENQSENAIPIQVNHFFNIEDLGRFYRSFTGNRQDLFFLCDYELVGSAMDGLQFIQELHIEEQSVLITSHFDDLGLQSKCSEMGVRFIPKNLAGFVPIKMDQLSVSKKFKKLIGLPDSKSKPSMGFENQILARNR